MLYTLSEAPRTSLFMKWYVRQKNMGGKRHTARRQTLRGHFQTFSPFYIALEKRYASVAGQIDPACAWRAKDAVNIGNGCKSLRGTYRSDASMVCKHEPTDTMIRGDIRRFSRQCNLNWSWTPWNEIRQLAFANPQERLMDLLCVSQLIFDS